MYHVPTGQKNVYQKILGFFFENRSVYDDGDDEDKMATITIMMMIVAMMVTMMDGDNYDDNYDDYDDDDNNDDDDDDDIVDNKKMVRWRRGYVWGGGGGGWTMRQFLPCHLVSVWKRDISTELQQTGRTRSIWQSNQNALPHTKLRPTNKQLILSLNNGFLCTNYINIVSLCIFESDYRLWRKINSKCDRW